MPGRIMQIPEGFLFAAAEAAIKKPGRKDIALVVSEADAVMAGTFTINAVKAAPVRLCMQNIRSERGRAIIINSGNANACTGKKGLADARKIVSVVSEYLSIRPSLTYMCSTGVIGTPMPMKRIIPSLDELVDNLGRSSFRDVAEAIMTTDTFPKLVSKRVRIGDRQGIISGVCKGSGMIAPNMATMLSFIITDIAIEYKVLDFSLREAVKKSFNRITVDGDMSTNDTVLIMSNGMMGNAPITKRSPYRTVFTDALNEVVYDLSRLIVKDGEGATKLVEIMVKGATKESDAEKAALAVANSNLVKTAIYGNDANWGRIMAALGHSGIAFREDRTDIYFDKVKVVNGGLSNGREEAATNVLKSKEIRITVDLHSGDASAKVLTCDLTEEYIRINAEYRT
jgi:glutamate N-acetyltransferase/amino-acid N-acetyltransferase